MDKVHCLRIWIFWYHSLPFAALKRIHFYFTDPIRLVIFVKFQSADLAFRDATLRSNAESGRLGPACQVQKIATKPYKTIQTAQSRIWASCDAALWHVTCCTILGERYWFWGQAVRCIWCKGQGPRHGAPDQPISSSTGQDRSRLKFFGGKQSSGEKTLGPPFLAKKKSLSNYIFKILDIIRILDQICCLVAIFSKQLTTRACCLQIWLMSCAQTNGWNTDWLFSSFFPAWKHVLIIWYHLVSFGIWWKVMQSMKCFKVPTKYWFNQLMRNQSDRHWAICIGIGVTYAMRFEGSRSRPRGHLIFFFGNLSRSSKMLGPRKHD